MRKLNKKGFTTVELVIVIAVIAILAAVLIPTFIGLVNRANESSDIQAVRNMNGALAADGAVVPTSQADLFEVLESIGMDAKNFKPLTKDTYFFWDKDLNRVLYTNEKYEVLFPEEYKELVYVAGTSQWISLSGGINIDDVDVDTVINTTANETKITVATGTEFVAAALEILDNQSDYTSGAKKVVIEITEDIDLMGADVCFLEKAANSLDVVISSPDAENPKTISGLYISDKHAVKGTDGRGNVSSTYGHSLFNSVKSITVENVIIKDSTIGGYKASQASFFAGQVKNGASFTNVTISNCEIQGKNKVGALVGFVTGGEVKFENVIIENCAVSTAEGEAGIAFGVITSEKDNANRDAAATVKSTGITIRNSTVSIADIYETKVINSIENVDAYKGTINVTVNAANMPLNNEIVLHEAGGARVGVATYGFILLNQSSESKVSNLNIRVMMAVNTRADLDKTYAELNAAE